MRLFQDNSGRAWEIAIDTGTIKRVRSLIGFDLLSIVENEGKAILELRDDPVKLVDIAYAICEPQAKKLGVSDEEFGRSMIGDALDSAWSEILGGMADFFSGGRRRILTMALLQAGVAIQIDERTKQSLLGPVPPPTCGAKSTGWRGALGRLLGRTPTANCR